MQQTQLASSSLLRWSGFLTGLILGIIVSFAGSIMLGAKYLANTPAVPPVDGKSPEWSNNAVR